MLESSKRTQALKQLGPVLEPNTSWYDRWYFELRLAEEVYRAGRYNLSSAVVIAVLPAVRSFQKDNDLSEALRTFSGKLRFLDLAGVLAPNIVALCLPHTDRTGALVVVDRLASALEGFEAHLGIAVCPEDASEGDKLLEVALERCRSRPRGHSGKAAA